MTDQPTTPNTETKLREVLIDQMNRMADWHRETGGKGLPMGFQVEMRRLEAQLNPQKPGDKS